MLSANMKIFNLNIIKRIFNFLKSVNIEINELKIKENCCLDIYIFCNVVLPTFFSDLVAENNKPTPNVRNENLDKNTIIKDLTQYGKGFFISFFFCVLVHGTQMSKDCV